MLVVPFHKRGSRLKGANCQGPMGHYKSHSWYPDPSPSFVQAHLINHHAVVCLGSRMWLEDTGMHIEQVESANDSSWVRNGWVWGFWNPSSLCLT